MFNMVVVGADLVAGQLATMAAVWPTKEASIVTHFGQLYQTRVRAAASGRPGPRAITGNYRRSISLEVGRSASGTVAIVGTNAPQARRLEFGFVGSDSLGRHYNQPPYPHFEPPLAQTIEQLANALNIAVAS